MNQQPREELTRLDHQHLKNEDVWDHINLVHQGQRNQIIVYRKDDFEALVLLKDVGEHGITRLDNQVAIDLAPGQLQELGQFLLDISEEQ